MKYLTCILAAMMAIILYACNNEEEPNTPKEGHDTYESVCSIIERELKNGGIRNFQQVEQLCSTLEGVKSIEVKSEVIYITFDNQLRYFIDFSGAMSTDINSLDNHEDVNDILEEIEMNIGLADESENDTYGSSDVRETDLRSGAESRAETKSSSNLLTKRNILLWSPMALKGDGFLEKFDALIRNFRKRFGNLTVTKVYDNGKQDISTVINSLSLFNQYDLVFVVSHGTPTGEIVIPRNEYFKDMKLEKGSVLNFETDQMESVYVLNNKYMESLLPKKMDKTVVWTCMCHAASDNAVFRNLCKLRDVADFYGGDSAVTADVSLQFFKIFYSYWLYGRGSDKALNIKRIKMPYDFFSIRQNMIKGNWCPMPDSYHSLYYGKFNAQKPKSGPCVRAIAGKDWLKRYYNRSESRSAVTSLMGILFTNIETHEQSKVYFSDNNIAHVSDNKSKDEEIANIVIEMKVDGIAPGKYEYRSFVDKPEDNTYILSPDFSTIEIPDLSLDSPIGLYTREDLVEFIKSMYVPNSRFDNHDILLMNDIDIGELDMYYWDYVNSDYKNIKSFDRIFEGNGYTITRTFVNTYGRICCIIPKLSTSGIIRNLNMEIIGHDLHYPQCMRSILCESNDGEISNCNIHIDANIIPDSESQNNWKYIEALYCEDNNGLIENCSINGSIKGHVITGGLFVMYNDNFYTYAGETRHYNGRIIGCNANVDIDTKTFVGYIEYNYGIIDNCTLTGSITTNGTTCGFVSVNKSPSENFTPTISNCTNSAAITAYETGDTYVCGICGSNSAAIVNCTNTGDIKLFSTGYAHGSYSAGITCTNIDKGTITNCVNRGYIQGVMQAAGISTQTEVNSWYTNGTITKCTNYGVITYDPGFNYKKKEEENSSTTRWAKFGQIALYHTVGNHKSGKVKLNPDFEMMEVE